MHHSGEGAHVVACSFRIVQDVATLLRVHSCDTVPVCCQLWKSSIWAGHVQQGALKTQGHGSIGRDDGLAGFSHVDVEDRFARHLLEGGLGAQSGHEPVSSC